MCNIWDDIVIGSYDYGQSDHDRNAQQVLKTAHCKGMEFNADKCMFHCEYIPFFGMILSREGMQPFPNTVKELQVLPWHGQLPWEITPRLALLIAALRQLIKKWNA